MFRRVVMIKFEKLHESLLLKKKKKKPVKLPFLNADDKKNCIYIFNNVSINTVLPQYAR